MNSLFKPYLPLDEEGFVTISNSHDILSKEYALSPLIRCLKKAELHLEVRQEEEEEVIVLTDDDNDRYEEESASYPGGSSISYESNDCDWYSASSQQGNQSSHSQNIIETVSIDSPPPPLSHKKSPSLSSLDSCGLNLDTTNSLATDRNGESDQLQSEIVTDQQQNTEAMPSQENNRSLSTPLNDSLFNRLVNDINSTHFSVPDNGNLSSDSKMNENGESSQTVEDNEVANSRSDENISIENEQLDEDDEIDEQNGVASQTLECASAAISPTNGDLRPGSVNDEESSEKARDMTPSASNNHNDENSTDPSEAVNICDNNTNIISSGSLLQNHEETLKNIEEIVTDDLKNLERPHSTTNEVDVEMEANKDHANGSNTVQDGTPQDFVPAAESTASVIAETSLLSKSEQDVLFKDRDAALIITDLWNNGSTEETTKPEEGKMSSRDTNDSPSPIPFLQNGIDPSLRLKTYGRRNRTRFVETKTISTQTSNCPSPVTTIDENDTRKKDKHLLAEKEDDEIFLRDCFTTPEVPSRSSGSPRIRSPMFLPSSPVASVASAPIASTPIASISTATSNLTDSLQTTIDSSAVSITDSGQVVKRKRGRPRKYPLPEPGTTPVKPPKPPRQPRQPRKPKPPKDPNESGEVEVFERMKLRERKPKVVPPPPPPALPKKKSLSGRSRSPKKAMQEKPQENQPEKVKGRGRGRPRKEEKEKTKEGKRRRNTIKMTIDAIFNTQSPRFSAFQARRISQILGIPFSSPQLATILKRRNYDKSINASQNMNNDGSINESESMLQTFKGRSNGQLNSTEPSTTQSTSTSTPSTILARKTYIKPNLTFSSFSSFSSALRRMSRRVSFGTRRISFSSAVPRHPVCVTNTRKSRSNKQPKSAQSQQRYTKIDVFDTSTKSKRGRKKGSKDTVPRKRKQIMATTIQLQQQLAKIPPEKINPIVDLGPKIDETIELVDLTKEIAPFELDISDEMGTQFDNIDTALSSTQHFHNDSEVVPKKRQFFRSDDTETDVTNEFTTDPESTFEDADDSNTRKSKRSRKRPKILDL